jgi:diguanylate cyclase (GGDEF)-like protein
MALDLAGVFDTYPNPFYLVRPAGKDGGTGDFEYVYVNRAFSDFLGRKQEELVGHRVQESSPAQAEQKWLDLYADVAREKKHVYLGQNADQGILAEAFHVEPDLCGCVIHNLQGDPQNLETESEGLWHRANCDYLTNFYNRHYLQNVCKDFVHENKVGVTYLDINNLKETNDTKGHAAGDELILRISNLIRTHYKGSLLFRVGGDEFLALTTGLDREQFLRLSETGQTAFGDLVSMGYRYYDQVDDLSSCIAQCDSMMYEQKRLQKSAVGA